MCGANIFSHYLGTGTTIQSLLAKLIFSASTSGNISILLFFILLLILLFNIILSMILIILMMQAGRMEGWDFDIGGLQIRWGLA